MAQSYRKEMSLRRSDLLRLLPRAAAPFEYDISENIIRIEAGEGRIVIRFSEEGLRTIGSLSFPVLVVDFEFSGFSNQQINRFLEKFDRTYQRGGG